MAPTKRQLKKKIKELKEKLAKYNNSEPTQPQDVINWLFAQAQAPHPLDTSFDTMMLWLEAMGTGASRISLQRRLGPLMQLWREQGIPNVTFTVDQQEQWIAERGANMRPVVLTTTWQQYVIAKESGELKRTEEEKKKEEERERQERKEQEEEWYQRGRSLGLIDPLPRSHPASSAHASTSATAGHGECPSGPRFRYAPGPVPDLFSGYSNPWQVGSKRLPSAEQSPSQQQAQDEQLARQLEEQEATKQREQQEREQISVPRSRLPMPIAPVFGRPAFSPALRQPSVFASPLRRSSAFERPALSSPLRPSCAFKRPACAPAPRPTSAFERPALGRSLRPSSTLDRPTIFDRPVGHHGLTPSVRSSPTVGSMSTPSVPLPGPHSGNIRRRQPHSDDLLTKAIQQSEEERADRQLSSNAGEGHGSSRVSTPLTGLPMASRPWVESCLGTSPATLPYSQTQMETLVPSSSSPLKSPPKRPLIRAQIRANAEIAGLQPAAQATGATTRAQSRAAGEAAKIKPAAQGTLPPWRAPGKAPTSTTASTTAPRKRVLETASTDTGSAQPRASSRRRLSQGKAARDTGHETDETQEGPIRVLRPGTHWDDPDSGSELS
jgi:hypothetical protein